jgi:two-component system, sensor histidine kinase and response regulator
MPGLDGFETAARLRDMERQTGRRIPIVALTAHAAGGVRERCLGAGMDAHLAKPFHPLELYAAVEGRGSVDRETLLAQTAGDRGLIAELARTFLEDYPKTSAALQDAFLQGSANVVQELAHRLKGSLGTLAMTKAHEAATRIEEAARLGNLEEATLAWRAVQVEIEGLHVELSVLAGGGRA